MKLLLIVILFLQFHFGGNQNVIANDYFDESDFAFHEISADLVQGEGGQLFPRIKPIDIYLRLLSEKFSLKIGFIRIPRNNIVILEQANFQTRQSLDHLFLDRVIIYHRLLC